MLLDFGFQDLQFEARCSENVYLIFVKSLVQDDEDFLVDNEEEIAVKEEIEKTPISKEYLGKLQYKVRKVYQELFILLLLIFEIYGKKFFYDEQ